MSSSAFIPQPAALSPADAANGAYRNFFRRFCAIAVIAACACSSNKGGKESTAGPGGALGDTVVCMSYNVENLFDCEDDGAEYPEYRPGKCNWNAETFDRKLHNIAAAIAAAQPDIAILCEVENDRALQHLRRALRRRRINYKYSAIGDTPNPTATCPAILSRLPITDTRSHGIAKMDSFYTRNILEADIALGRHTLKVFANHWPSKRNPESHRIAAARVLRARLEELAPGADYICAGDFNANFDECECFVGRKLDDTHGQTGINHVVGTVESAVGDPVDYINEQELKEKSDELLHYNLWFELEPYQRLSYMYRNRPETPDHILVPASLYDNKGICYVDNSFAVFRWSGRLIFKKRPYRWQYRWTRQGRMHVGEGYSDHLPLLVKLCVCGA
jgi:endonuclease/exonuclease/phosphatase family metal-dependent hydrolase